MNEQEYVKQRLDDKINWYDTKSQWNQKWFKRLRMAEIAFASAIPLLVGFVTSEGLNLKITVGLLGVGVAVISGVLALNKFQENWIEYRCMTEALTHEKFLYMTRTQPYDQDPPFPLLVHRVESLMSTENSSWAKYIAKNEPLKFSKGG